MKIGIDARMYGPAVGGGGLGRYVQELVSGLLVSDRSNAYTLFLKSENADGPKTDRTDVTKSIVDIHWYTFKEQLALPGRIDDAGLDLIHFPHWNVPLGLKTPFLVTIHDLILLEEPRSVKATTRNPLVFAAKHLGFRLTLGSTLKRARKIIAVSQYTKESILRFFPHISADKIVVIHEGVSELPAPELPAIMPEIPYLLYVGNAYPHKNLDLLLSAFRQLLVSHPGLRLALAGREDAFIKRLQESPEALALGESLRFIPNPTDAELAALYQHALGYVFPSRMEGFGLPPLEAMKAGVPVAASKAGSLPEVLANAALYFDPRDVNSITHAMDRLVSDASLRTLLIENGQHNLQRFSWHRTTQETIQVYQDILKAS